MELLEQLWDDGVTVVTAAGNNGPGAGTVTAPGISRKVITDWGQVMTGVLLGKGVVATVAVVRPDAVL